MNYSVDEMVSGREQFSKLAINHEYIQDCTNLFYVLCSPLEGEVYHALDSLKRTGLLHKKGFESALRTMLAHALKFNNTTLVSLNDDKLVELLGLAMDEISDMITYSWEFMENDLAKAHVQLMNIKIITELMHRLYVDMRKEINPKVKGLEITYVFPDREVLYAAVKVANEIDRLRKKYLPKLSGDTCIYNDRRRQAFDAILQFGKLKPKTI